MVLSLMEFKSDLMEFCSAQCENVESCYSNVSEFAPAQTVRLNFFSQGVITYFDESTQNISKAKLRVL